jgi:DNA-binding response OmpR family regulator
MMFTHVPSVVSRRRLANDIWCCDEDLASRSIEQHMYQLRRKLRLCAGGAIVLRCIYGTGYRIDVVGTDAWQSAAA